MAGGTTARNTVYTRFISIFRPGGFIRLYNIIIVVLIYFYTAFSETLITAVSGRRVGTTRRLRWERAIPRQLL